jgi:lysyl-tRNA synthetase class I
MRERDKPYISECVEARTPVEAAQTAEEKANRGAEHGQRLHTVQFVELPGDAFGPRFGVFIVYLDESNLKKALEGEFDHG